MHTFIFSNIIHGQSYDWKWKSARATFYGADAWSIHRGSCQYGLIDPCKGTGWDVAALSDVYWGYSGSCGRCYEIACEDKDLSDGYGNYLRRTGVCRDKDASVIVTVVDTCPCNYPNNAYSNRRWCCGDMDHFDISVYAFEKLADLELGVIAIMYRPVPCDHVPWKKPWPLQPPTGPHGLPPGVTFPNDAANCQAWNNLVRPNDTKAGQTQQNNAPPHQGYIDPHFRPSRLDEVVYMGGPTSGWKDVSDKMSDGPGAAGLILGTSRCGRVAPGGSIAFRGVQNILVNRTSLELWVKVPNEGQLSGLEVNLASDKGSCRPAALIHLHSPKVQQGYHQYVISLYTFSHEASEPLTRGLFSGCGDNLPGRDLQMIQLINRGDQDQDVCVDGVKLI